MSLLAYHFTLLLFEIDDLCHGKLPHFLLLTIAIFTCLNMHGFSTVPPWILQAVKCHAVSSAKYAAPNPSREYATNCRVSDMATTTVFVNIRLSAENLNNCKVKTAIAYRLLNCKDLIEEVLVTCQVSTNLKSSFTVIRTMCVLVLSTYGNDMSFFTKLESSLRFLNLAITIMSVSPVMSYTAHTLGNLAICLSRSTILPFVAVISMIAVRS